MITGQKDSLAIREDVPLADHTTLNLGGPARRFLRVTHEEELFFALSWADSAGLPVWILGGGSNLVVSDSGVDGLVVQIAFRGVRFQDVSADTVLVEASAGEPWDPLVERCVDRNLAGLECLSGIPGLVGATPIQNVGAYGQSVSDTIDAVRVLSRESGTVAVLSREECDFVYRGSRFKRERDRFVVLSVRFLLSTGAPKKPRYRELERALAGVAPTVQALRETVIELRRRKSMVIESDDPNRRSAGSFFLNPIVDPSVAKRVVEQAVGNGWVSDPADVPCHEEPDGKKKLAAAWLIEKAGFKKGTRRGAVGQSSKHALALVHHGGGTTAKLLDYARELRDGVEATFGIRLAAEPTLWGAEI